MKRGGKDMGTKEPMAVLASLPEEARSILLALSIVTSRINTLAPPDRDDLFALMVQWRKTGPDEHGEILRAMEEILTQKPPTSNRMLMETSEGLKGGSKKWALYVGGKIKEFREKAGMTQVQLSQAAGLPQSHLSRLENAEYTATSITLEKIATALGITVRELDSCLD